MEKNKLRKDFFWNIIGTSLNAFNSLFFMIIATRINGINDAGIFTFAFTCATVFYVIGVYAGRIYEVTDLTNKNDMDFIISKTVTCFVMLIISIIFIIINRYSLYKSLIILLLCILKMFEAFSETTYAIIQKRDYLYKVGISFTIKSIMCLLSFLIVDLLTKNLLYSLIAMNIIYILIYIFFDFPIIKKLKITKTFKYENVKSILTNGFLAFLLAFLTSFVINSPKYVIDYTLEEKYQTIYSILVMPASVIYLFTQFIIHPFLNKITNFIKDKDYEKVKNIVKKFSISMFAFGIFAIVIAYFIGIPFLNFIYNINLLKYKSCLIIVLIGALFYGISSILSSILMAMRKFNIQIAIYSITSILSIILNYFLIKIMNMGVNGACISYTIITILIYFLFTIVSNKKFNS